MKVDIYNIRELVKLNDLKPVTQSIYLNSDYTPTDNGLFSYEIFGYPGTKERRELPAYIDLKGHYINPYIYKRWSLMDRRIVSVIAGKGIWQIKAGKLEEVPEDFDFAEAERKNPILPSGKRAYHMPGNGLEWLYENYHLIKYEKTDSLSRSDNIDMLKLLKRDEIFCDCWLVQPAFYRDLDFSQLSSGKINVDEVNKLYMALINAVEATTRISGVSFLTCSAQVKVQNLLLQIHDFILSQNKGKTGMVRNYLIGKAIDYTARSVISCPQHDRANTYQEDECKIGEICIPLHTICAMYRPLIVRYVRELMGDKLKGVKRIIMSGSTGDINNSVELFSETFSDDNIEKMMSLYEKSQEDRFSILYIQSENNKKPEPLLLYYDVLKRPFTLCDMLFLAAYKAIQEPGITTTYTRYPVISYHNTQIGKINILTTEKTITMDFNKLFKSEEMGQRQSFLGVIKNYPDIRYAHSWRDAAVLNNSQLEAMGNADHD